MSTYAIGDVQGCFVELKALLRKLAFDPSRDEVWLVGDLVNRGPKSLQVLRYVRALGDAAKVVLGNHDLHLLALAHDRRHRARPTDTLDDVLDARDRDELLDWLRCQPLLHHDARIGWTMVHAGLAPQWDLRTARACAREVEAALRDDRSMRELFAHMYGNRPDRWSPRLHGTDRWRFIVNCFTRLRVCDAKGTVDLGFKGPLDAIPKGRMPWFRVPARRSRRRRVVFGHWSALDYYDGEGVLALDTGCVWGGRLCAARLDEPPEPVCVRSRQPKRDSD
jgi:bis(5'-nucleosyl)-tetraphosphatase (symmetrical)